MAKSAGGTGKRGETHYNRKDTGKKPAPRSPRTSHKEEGPAERRSYSKHPDERPDSFRKRTADKPSHMRQSEGPGKKPFRRETPEEQPFPGKRFERKDSFKKSSEKTFRKEGQKDHTERGAAGSRKPRPRPEEGTFRKTFSRKPEEEGFDNRKKSFRQKPSGPSKQGGYRKDAGKNRTRFEREEFEEHTNPGKPGKWNTEVKTGPMTLNKYLAHAGISSRRDAASIVKEGRVKVNGATMNEPGYRVQAHDKVTLDGKPIQPQKHFVYVLLNKPKDFITTTEDDKGRRTVMELVAGASDDRLYPVGRLDRNTTGVLLLTNDGDLAQKLSHPKYEHKKIYQVHLNKELTKRDFDQILEGVSLEDGLATVDRLAFLEKKNEIGLEIHSGRNRIVRRIFEHLGYEVEKLDRVMYAGLTKKNVSRGQWRFLTEKEVIALKHFRS
ncbi:MAG: rRNA pseudouridine synthase [Bacteroidetes bacterium]|nr:rRNA pseudouridine synthase [Bacteroidota bacterium]